MIVLAVSLPLSAYETQKSAGPDNDTGATHFLELNAFRTTNKRDHQTVSECLCCVLAVCARRLISVHHSW